MTFLSPFPLVLAAAAAAAVVALHLLTTRRPPPAMLPTARFVPVAEARAVARASRPTDVLLMVLRVLAVLLVGAAFAQPALDAAGPSVRTVVLLERSAAVPDAAAALERARAELGEGGALVVFADSAREADEEQLDSLAASTVSSGVPASGSLSAAFVAARAAAARIATGADSVRLVVVSPILTTSVDAATPALRESWPGRVEIVRVATVADTARGGPAELVTTLEDDPLAPAIALLGGVVGGDGVRIQRGALTAADSAWARGGDRVLLAWPARFAEPVSAAAVTAFAGHDATVVAPFARLLLPGDTAHVVARWNDGAPAVVQEVLGAGCVRHVAIGIPLAGDITLRAPFVALVGALSSPCGGPIGTPLPDSALTWLTGRSGAPLAAAPRVAAQDPSRTSRLPAVLLAAALALLVAEQVLRRRGAE